MSSSRLFASGAFAAVVLASCDVRTGEPPGPGDAGPNGLVNGCPSYPAPIMEMTSDTWDDWAGRFFSSWCTRCHATANTGAARNGAPSGFNWDDEASVRDHLSAIRNAVGVDNYMPLNAPYPPCGERRRVVVWIDQGAP